MPVGIVTLLVVAVLIYFGIAHRVLDRMRLTDRAALIWIALVIAGSFFNVTLVGAPVRLTLNLGGGLVPPVFAIWLLATADEARERVRGTVAALVSAGAIYSLGTFLPPEPPQTFLEPQYLFAIVAGAVAYLLGRSRRAAFAAAVLGIVLADLIQYTIAWTRAIPGSQTWVGGAGAFDAVIVAGIVAVLLAEGVGETLERIQGGPARRPARETGGLVTPHPDAHDAMRPEPQGAPAGEAGTPVVTSRPADGRAVAGRAGPEGKREGPEARQEGREDEGD